MKQPIGPLPTGKAPGSHIAGLRCPRHVLPRSPHAQWPAAGPTRSHGRGHRCCHWIKLAIRKNLWKSLEVIRYPPKSSNNGVSLIFHFPVGFLCDGDMGMTMGWPDLHPPSTIPGPLHLVHGISLFKSPARTGPALGIPYCIPTPKIHDGESIRVGPVIY